MLHLLPQLPPAPAQAASEPGTAATPPSAVVSMAHCMVALTAAASRQPRHLAMRVAAAVPALGAPARDDVRRVRLDVLAAWHGAGLGAIAYGTYVLLACM
jgi:hypothetical protein